MFRSPRGSYPVRDPMPSGFDVRPSFGQFPSVSFGGSQGSQGSQGSKRCAPEQPMRCDPREPYRKMDGSCNNLAKPKWGAINQPMRRLLPAVYFDGD